MYEGVSGAHDENVDRPVLYQFDRGGGRHEAKRQERCRRWRKLMQPVEVQLGRILELEIIYLVGCVRQCRQGLVHIREGWRDQGRAFQLTYVGIPGCKGAPL